MSNSDDRLTGRERMTLRTLRAAPWLAFLLLTLPAPAYFFLRYLAADEGAGEWMLVALTTLVGGALVGLFVAAIIVLYRAVWMKRLRERLAADGVTAAELRWFTGELTREERRALAEIGARNPLLAEAYRDTLAARVTATRLLARVGREAELVERRLAGAGTAAAPERGGLEAELRADRERLARVVEETRGRQAQTETRLRAIEAAASRSATEQETRVALERLEMTHAQIPRPLEDLRLESEARAEIDQELRRAQLGPTSPDENQNAK